MSMHSHPPTRMSRISRYIGPFALLSIVTSLAFNRAILARERNEQRRLHELQMSLLAQLNAEASSKVFTSTTSILSSLQEQRKLARRMRALQLDPLRLGFSRLVLPSIEEEGKLQRARDASTSWGSALFGSGTVNKLRESIKKATEAIRARGFASGPIQISSSEEDEADAAWVKALEESLESAYGESKVKVNSGSTKMTEPELSLRSEEEQGMRVDESLIARENVTPTSYKRRLYA